jgi:hypothetical protein
MSIAILSVTTTALVYVTFRYGFAVQLPIGILR